MRRRKIFVPEEPLFAMNGMGPANFLWFAESSAVHAPTNQKKINIHHHHHHSKVKFVPPDFLVAMNVSTFLTFLSLNLSFRDTGVQEEAKYSIWPLFPSQQGPPIQINNSPRFLSFCLFDVRSYSPGNGQTGRDIVLWSGETRYTEQTSP